jgi:hypothetical protein
VLGLQPLADHARDAHRRVDAARGDQGRRRGFEHVPDNVLDRCFPIGTGDRDDGRFQLIKLGPGLIPIATLDARLGRSEQQIGADQRQRNELRRGDPDQYGQSQRDRVDPLGARRHRQLLFRRLARIALDRRGDKAGQPGERDEHDLRHQRQQDQLRRENREEDQRQPPIPAAILADPPYKAPDIVLLLLKQVQVRQKPARRENGEAERGEQDN